MFARRNVKKKKQQKKLVARYIHTKGFFRLAGRSPVRKNANFTKNRIILAIIVGVFIAPGIYFCFY